LSVNAVSVSKLIPRRIRILAPLLGIVIILATFLHPVSVHANGIHQNAVEVFRGETSSYSIRVVTNPEVGNTHFSINLQPIPANRATHPVKISGTAQSKLEESLRLQSTAISIPSGSPYIYTMDFPIDISGPWVIELDIQELDLEEFIKFEVLILDPPVVRWWLIMLVVLVVFSLVGIVSRKMSNTKNRY